MQSAVCERRIRKKCFKLGMACLAIDSVDLRRMAFTVMYVVQHTFPKKEKLRLRCGKFNWNRRFGRLFRLSLYLLIFFQSDFRRFFSSVHSVPHRNRKFSQNSLASPKNHVTVPMLRKCEHEEWTRMPTKNDITKKSMLHFIRTHSLLEHP